MYSISNYFPFLDKADFIKNVRETHSIDEFLGYESLITDFDSQTSDSSNRVFKAYRIMPSDTLFLMELPSTVLRIFSGDFGGNIIVDIMEFDYQGVANIIETDLVNDVNKAIFACNGAYLVEDIVTDTFINACANGFDVPRDISVDYKVLEESDKQNKDSLSSWLFMNDNIDESYIMESALVTLQMLKDRRKNGKSNDAEEVKGKDAVYTWLDAYFSLPEGEEMKSGGREVVPLLIGPTAVFKSATVKELCKKYNYRMVDFRVAFTSRLDYSGLFQIGEVEGKKYSYACPMEEIVVCSDGFREFCKQSYQKLEDILQKGYTEEEIASDGNEVDTEKKYLTDEQKDKIVGLQLQYKNYMRTPVLFCDEITRCFSGSTKVKLLDGRSLSMEELYNEFGSTKPFYVYSCDKDGNVAFKKAYSNGVTRRDADVVKVTLDNGSSIICTPDHRFMLRDGSYEMAMHFESGRSLMSTYFNYKNSSKTPFGSTYETFINPRDMKEYYTHREVARQYYSDTYGKLGKDGCFRNAHHVDFNSLNNVPENLRVMDRIEHYNLHIHGENSVSKRLQSVDGYLDMQRNCMRKAMQHPDFFKNQRKGLEEYWGSRRHNEVMTSDERNKSFKTAEFKDMCSSRCKFQWSSGQFDNIDRISASHKANFEKAVRFVKILNDVGYDINIDNYQGFVDTFTGQHGIYYSVVSEDWFNVDESGYVLSDVFDEVNSRDWIRFFNSNKKILDKIKSLNYDETKQGICDGTYDTTVGDYVDLSNKGVRDTLSFLNYLLSEYGDFTNREYMAYHSERDLDRYHFAFRYGNLCKHFGSFARAKDLASVYNHKVVSVEILPYKEDVYDIEVEDTHNFLIDLGDDSGVFVHNCRDKGVNGILVQLLNQKKLNDMTLNGCKFVAATNLDIQKGLEREEYRMELDMLYDVNTDLDVAYSNRFIPLKVYPNDVMDRWFEWASGTTDKKGFKGVSNIHPVVLEFLNNNRDMVYNDKPVLDAIAEGLSDNEQRTQVFPNYRTWDMLSDYLYSVDKTAEAENDGKEDSGEEKLYKRKILEGYVSKWCCEKFIPFLESKGYSNFDEVKEPVKDDVGDFLSTALETGSPAMLIGPSALGKTSRVKQYMKKAKIKTGLEPVLINVNLASKDAVDLMGMPVKQSLTEYVGGGILKGSGLDDVSKALQGVVANVSADIKYGMTDIMTLRAPDKTIKDRFVTALKEGREVILFFDEVNRVSSNTVTSAVFEVISDYRFAGVDFSNYKDKVKVVAACNMAWEGMDDEVGGYGDTGTLDPAFAARFSIYWKKNYDENDVASWIEFMESQKEEGLIDGTLIEFFKGLEPEKALKIMASVEKRTLEDAQPSTRNMLQLSKDIKSMRGRRQENGTFKAKAFNGKILFTDDVAMMFEDLVLELQSDSLESHAQKTVKFLDSLLYGSESWESLLIGDSVKIGDTSISASDIIDSLVQCRYDLKQFTLKPMSSDDRVDCSDTIDLVEDLAGFVRQLDINTGNKREDMFKMYLGESILGEFTKYFNNTFGTNLDEDISIEQLSDKTLIIPFMKIVQRNFSKYSGNTEGMVRYCLDLCKEFMEVHGTSLPNENYAMFLTGIKDILPNADNMVLFLRRSDEGLEEMYKLAEGVGDDWIIDITSDFGNKSTKADIEAIRQLIKDSKKTKKDKNVKYNVL
jgi:DNA gyrase, B subunit|nr:MAG TPA: hypothetical protein [Caudoviricetes sp.]